MLFNWSLWNHSITGAISCHDLIDGLAYPMHDLGHKSFACKEALMKPPYVNILFENFPIAQQVDVVRQAREMGCRFVMVVTEMPHKMGFNGGKRMGLTERMNNFPDVIQYIDVVFCLCPGAAEKIRDWYGHPCVMDVELGYSETFQRLVATWQKKPKEHDFGFCGPLTENRVAILSKMQKLGFNVRAEGWVPPQDVRDESMMQCRVGLNVKADRDTQPISSSRLSRTLATGLPIVSQPVNGASIWKDKKIAHFATKHSKFHDEAHEVLKNFRDVHDEQMRRFKEWLHPEAAIGQGMQLIKAAIPEVAHINGYAPMEFVRLVKDEPQVHKLTIPA